MDRFDSKDEGSFRAANSLRTDGRSPDFLIGIFPASPNYSPTAIVSVTDVTVNAFRSHQRHRRTTVVPDKAQQALERLLNKKSPPSV